MAVHPNRKYHHLPRAVQLLNSHHRTRPHYYPVAATTHLPLHNP